MKRVIWWIVFVVLLGGGGFLLGQTVPRFHRYAQSRLDDRTYLDLVKDAGSNTCWLVYVVERQEGAVRMTDGVRTVAVTTLGPVKCDPIPVPGGPVGPPVPGSPVR